MTSKLIAKFIKKSIITSDGHWLINKQKRIYHRISIKKRHYYLHRYVFCLVNNLDYDGDFEVCHKRECHNDKCWNPDHMYKGDRSSNMKDRVYETMCRKGLHSLNKENTGIYLRTGQRWCKECAKTRKLLRKAG